MPLLAHNLTGTSLALAAGNPAPSLPASSSPPERGAAFDVTSELRPNLTVDPINGVSGGLSAVDYTAIAAQVSADDIEIDWSDGPEYLTGDLDPGLPGVTLKIKMDIVPPPAAGVDTAIMGFQIIDYRTKKNLALAVRVEFAAFLDSVPTVPLPPGPGLTAGGVLIGSITAGEETSALEANSEAATGKFTCMLTETNHRTDVIRCCLTFGSPNIDCTDFRRVTFIP